jgi:phage gp36-like protein
MAWITLTEADVQASCGIDMIDAWREHLASGQVDPLPSIMADVVDEVRGAVVTQYPLAATGIPRSLKNAAVDISIYRLAKRVLVSAEGLAVYRTAADDAQRKLTAVAEGKLGVESDSDVAAATEQQIAMPAFEDRTTLTTPSRELSFTREDEEGL